MTQIPGGLFIGRKSSRFSFLVINSERKTILGNHGIHDFQKTRQKQQFSH